jgi:hypothetical protein
MIPAIAWALPIRFEADALYYWMPAAQVERFEHLFEALGSDAALTLQSQELVQRVRSCEALTSASGSSSASTPSASPSQPSRPAAETEGAAAWRECERAVLRAVCGGANVLHCAPLPLS